MPCTITTRKLNRADSPGIAISKRSQNGFGSAVVSRLWCVALVAACLALPRASQAEQASCAGDRRIVTQALDQIARSVDPCGESPEIAALLEQFNHCTRTYQICLDPQLDRNVFDRPLGPDSEFLPRTIAWNPNLRSELEFGCDGDPFKPVTRDPTASLLHEIVHAVQDCEGLDPGEHELEAVRVENIYRRAAGLCQRGRYGDELLPPKMIRSCGTASCACSRPSAPSRAQLDQPMRAGQALVSGPELQPSDATSGDRPR